MIEPSFQASDVNLFSELPVKRSLSRWFVILIGIPLLLEIVVLIVTGNLERFIWLLHIIWLLVVASQGDIVLALIFFHY